MASKPTSVRSAYAKSHNASDRAPLKQPDEDQYRFMVENVPGAIWKAPYNSFQFQYVSPEAERIFGYSQQECLQPGFLEKLIHPEEREWVFEYCRLASQEGHPYQLEFRILTKSGKEKMLRESIRIIYKNGKPYQKVGITFDVSLQSQTLDELTESNQKFYQAFHNFPISAAITRLKDARIMDVNRNFLKVSGYKRNEIVEKSVFELDIFINKSERDQIIRLLKTKKRVDKHPILLKDGYYRTRNVLLSAEFFDKSNEPCLLLMLHDVTERIKAEEALQQTNRELETFMYKSSHNLKGPVASIKGLLHLANLEDHNPKAKEYLELMSRSVRGLEVTLEELMDIARLKQGRLKVEAVELEYMLDEIVSKLKFMPEWEGISATIAVEQDLRFYTDSSLLYSILQNLVENAVKYKSGNKSPWLKVSAKVNKEWAEIMVQDNGVGIPENQHERVFEMFYRAHSSASGTGLGLYIVRNSVEKLGGSISLMSRRNEGTQFTLRLPNFSSGMESE